MAETRAVAELEADVVAALAAGTVVVPREEVDWLAVAMRVARLETPVVVAVPAAVKAADWVAEDWVAVGWAAALAVAGSVAVEVGLVGMRVAASAAETAASAVASAEGSAEEELAVDLDNMHTFLGRRETLPRIRTSRPRCPIGVELDTSALASAAEHHRPPLLLAQSQRHHTVG